LHTLHRAFWQKNDLDESGFPGFLELVGTG